MIQNTQTQEKTPEGQDAAKPAPMLSRNEARSLVDAANPRGLSDAIRLIEGPGSGSRLKADLCAQEALQLAREGIADALWKAQVRVQRDRVRKASSGRSRMSHWTSLPLGLADQGHEVDRAYAEALGLKDEPLPATADLSSEGQASMVRNALQRRPHRFRSPRAKPGSNSAVPKMFQYVSVEQELRATAASAELVVAEIREVVAKWSYLQRMNLLKTAAAKLTDDPTEARSITEALRIEVSALGSVVKHLEAVAFLSRKLASSPDKGGRRDNPFHHAFLAQLFSTWKQLTGRLPSIDEGSFLDFVQAGYSCRYPGDKGNFDWSTVLKTQLQHAHKAKRKLRQRQVPHKTT